MSTYDWYPEKRSHKRVTLCNPVDYIHVTDGNVARALMGMGLCEWEYYMGRLFTQAVSAAKEQKMETADITAMFSCDLSGIDDRGKYTKSQKNVNAFLMEKLFECVSDTDEELKVKVKPELFK